MNTETLRTRLLDGLAIPACPLPLDSQRQWSERHQRALTRYYAAAGAGGIAVGVHSTQFEIRDPQHGLFRPVLELVSRELDALGCDSMLKIAGISGLTPQAIAESETARDLGYHAGLLSLLALGGQNESVILDHCRTVSKTIPILGFYLQPAVGGQVFSFDFWRQFATIPDVVAVKIAPFNRYQTWDVVRAVLETGREDVALYTGNDDNIIVDLLTRFSAMVNGQRKSRFIDGGLLGQWGVGTQAAVELLKEIKTARKESQIEAKWLTENAALTDANAALFDAANEFAGCIPGIMEVLRRDGLVPSRLCLDPQLDLSPGQSEELDRVASDWPHLTDAEFITQHREQWLD